MGFKFCVLPVPAENAEIITHRNFPLYGIATYLYYIVSLSLYIYCIYMIYIILNYVYTVYVQCMHVYIFLIFVLQQILSPDGRKKTFNFQVSIPTPAPLIGFAIGCFEIFPDPSILEVTHFTLPGTLDLLKNTVGFVHEVHVHVHCIKM